MAFLFILSLLFNPIGLCIAILIVILLVYRLIVRTYPKTNKKPFILVFAISSLFIFSVDFIFNSVFEQRHRDRFNIVLGHENDSKGVGYNINQSKIAIGSGGFLGKGFLNGTQTKGGLYQNNIQIIFSVQ